MNQDMRWMPAEATEEMLNATKGPGMSPGSWNGWAKKRHAKLYRQMVAAAPAAPLPQIAPLDLNALERANLGKVVRPEDWMALLSYARALERERKAGTSFSSLHQGDAPAPTDVEQLVATAALGANEVDAEIVNARLDCAEGNLSAAANADPHGNSQMKDAGIHDSCSVAGIQGPPVAWRYRTPTGWHATTDAGKAACLKIDHGYEVEALGVLCMVDAAMKRSGEQTA